MRKPSKKLTQQKAILEIVRASRAAYYVMRDCAERDALSVAIDSITLRFNLHLLAAEISIKERQIKES